MVAPRTASAPAEAGAVMTGADPVRFRETLGHYPTGVVIVCAIDEDGAPQGMVIGSFTSVSLEPPLVAYFPTKTSRTYGRIRNARSFCVNVLAADQQHLCSVFSSRAEDKFAQVEWSPAPSGAPIIAGAVAWIDCEPYAVQDGGDHDIVLGKVTDLDVQSGGNPLLFFQGGYGRFSHRPLVSVDEDVIAAVRTAEAGREHLQGLADELGIEVNVIAAASNDELVYVATAVCDGASARTVLGGRFPLMAPLGELHVGGRSEEEIQAWAASTLGHDDQERDRQLLRVRQAHARGWSASLTGARPEGELRTALRRYSSNELTPAQHRELARVIGQSTRYYPPLELVDTDRYDLHSLMIAVPGQGERVELVLRMGQLPTDASGATVRSWIEAGQRVARRLECAAAKA